MVQGVHAGVASHLNQAVQLFQPVVLYSVRAARVQMKTSVASTRPVPRARGTSNCEIIA